MLKLRASPSILKMLMGPSLAAPASALAMSSLRRPVRLNASMSCSLVARPSSVHSKSPLTKSVVMIGHVIDAAFFNLAASHLLPSCACGMGPSLGGPPDSKAARCCVVIRPSKMRRPNANYSVCGRPEVS